MCKTISDKEIASKCAYLSKKLLSSQHTIVEFLSKRKLELKAILKLNA